MVARGIALVVFSLAYVVLVDAERNRNVLVPHTSSCGRTLSEDGILITSTHMPSERCSFTVTPGSFNVRKLLVRFEQLSLPAQGSVQPTITMTRYAEPVVVIRQNNSGVIGKTFSSLTPVEFEFRNMQKNSDFRIVITRTEDSILCSGEHYCTSTHYCIDKDLRCDRIDHCGDKSDETHYTCIYDSETQLTPIGVIIGGVVVAVIVVIAISVTVAICRRRSMLRGFSSRRAPMLATQAAAHGPAPGMTFMPVPQSDPHAAAGAPAQPCPYPQQQPAGVHWQPPAGPLTSVEPPAYEDATKHPQYPPTAAGTVATGTAAAAVYKYPAGYPVPSAYPYAAGEAAPYPAAPMLPPTAAGTVATGTAAAAAYQYPAGYPVPGAYPYAAGVAAPYPAAPMLP